MTQVHATFTYETTSCLFLFSELPDLSQVFHNILPAVLIWTCSWPHTTKAAATLTYLSPELQLRSSRSPPRQAGVVLG